MRADWSTPWPKVDLDGSKVGRVGERVRYLASGYFNSLDPLLPLGRTDDLTVEDLAPIMFRELCRRIVPMDQTHDGRERGADLLVAGGPVGMAPGLLVFSSNRPVSGDILAFGAMFEWSQEHRVTELPAPATIDEAALLAESLCRAFLTDSYRGWGIEHLLDPDALRAQLNRPGGYVPPSAFPLHLIAITATQITEWRIEK